jgi:hypothetical protein
MPSTAARTSAPDNAQAAVSSTRQQVIKSPVVREGHTFIDINL